MKKTALILILLSFIGGVLNYGRDYQPKNVSVVFKVQNSGTSGEIQRKKGSTGGNVHSGKSDRAGANNRLKQVSPAVLAASTHTPTALVQENQAAVAAQVRTIFSDDPETAVAVFRAESGLRPDAQGWNCYYNGVSKACLPEDRGNAWSVDCGVAQINIAGVSCPAELFNTNTNLEAAKEKYSRRGWQPWSAYNNGSYQAFLK